MKRTEEKSRQALFKDMVVPDDCSSDCNFLQNIKDIFNTKDSPTEYECTGSCEVCPEIN